MREVGPLEHFRPKADGRYARCERLLSETPDKMRPPISANAGGKGTAVQPSPVEKSG